jgi:hypothetical protein
LTVLDVPGCANYLLSPSTSFNPGLSETLKDGRHKLDIEKALSSVVEAKTLDEMQGAHAQIIMQVLTVLVLTCVPLLPLFFHITDNNIIVIALPLQGRSRMEQYGGSIQLGNPVIKSICQTCMQLIDTGDSLWNSSKTW